MPRITIDGKHVQVREGISLLEAARAAGITIPSLCSLEGIEPPTSCFVCVVKVQGRSGAVPSCALPVTEGMVVESETAEVHALRRRALELLLSDHAGDCEAPCTRICPCGLDIPTLARHMVTGEIQAAKQTILERMPFPGILGYICPAPCQKGCRRGKVDSAVSIRNLHQRMAEIGMPDLPAIPSPSAKRVAIIGAGPAGLSAAWYLSLRGHQCTVFDDHDRPGGTVRFGVSADVIPRDLLDEELDRVAQLGVTFRMDTRVGSDVSVESMDGTFDALILAAGENSSHLAKLCGIDVSARGIVVTNSFVTSRPRFFAAGSAISPGRLAARAVGQGRGVAVAVHDFFTGGAPTLQPGSFDSHLSGMSEEEVRKFAEETLQTLNSLPGGKEDGPLTDLTTAAGRCLGCDCTKKHQCDLRRFAKEYGAKQPPNAAGTRRALSRAIHGRVLVHEPGKCICCGRCVAISRKGGSAPGLCFVGRGFEVQVGPALGYSLVEALGSTLHQCVEACPTAALSKLGRRGE